MKHEIIIPKDYQNDKEYIISACLDFADRIANHECTLREIVAESMAAYLWKKFHPTDVKTTFFTEVFEKIINEYSDFDIFEIDLDEKGWEKEETKRKINF